MIGGVPNRGQQVADVGKAITACFFALCFILFIGFMVWALWP